MSILPTPRIQPHKNLLANLLLVCVFITGTIAMAPRISSTGQSFSCEGGEIVAIELPAEPSNINESISITVRYSSAGAAIRGAAVTLSIDENPVNTLRTDNEGATVFAGIQFSTAGIHAIGFNIDGPAPCSGTVYYEVRNGPSSAGSITDVSVTPTPLPASTPAPGTPVSVQGTFYIRWVDEFEPNGRIQHHQEYLLQQADNDIIVFELGENVSIPKGWPESINGHTLTADGVWESQPAELNSLSETETILVADSIEAQEAADVTASQVITGAQPYLTILCKFPDEAQVTYPKSWFETMMGSAFPGMDYFWQEVSYNAMNLSGSAVVGWYDLPKSRADYASLGGNLDVDCAAQADADVNFPDFVAVNIIIDKKCTDCIFVTGGAYTATLPYDGGAEYRMTSSSTYLFTPHYILGVLQHEMGHTFGMGHSSGPYADIYDSGWDVMSGYASGLTCDWKAPSCFQHPDYGFLGPHPIAYNKTVAGWIPAERIFNAQIGASSTITLERLALPPAGNYLMANIPIHGSATEFYTVEARKFVGYDVYLTGRERSAAVVIHKVDSSRDINTGPADVMDGDNNGNTNDTGSAWIVGETFADAANGITISVLSSTATGFVVSISNMVPGVPILQLPANNALLKNFSPLFDWTASTPPGGSYQIQVSTSNLFEPQNIVLDQNVSDSTMTAVTALDPNTLFHWRVRSLNVINTPSAWSAARAFHTPLAQPNLLSPLDGVDPLTVRPLFDWEDVPGATKYTIQISKNTSFAPLLLTGSPLTSTFTPASNLAANTTLHWRVQALGVNGPSPWSVTRSIASPNPPSIPALTSPALNALTTNYSPLLDWSNCTLPLPLNSTVFGRYRIQIATNAAFTTDLMEYTTAESAITTSFLIPSPALNPNTKFYWRVRAENNLNQYSAWSAVRYFRTAILPPTGASVPAPVTLLRPVFDWDDMPGASSYSIQVSKNSIYTLLSINTTASVSTYKPITDLPANTDFYWRVRANGVNGPSVWSLGNTFTSPKPASIPVLVAPASNALVTTYIPLFNWNNASFPAGTTFKHYQIQVDDDSDFSSTLIDAATTNGDINDSQFTPLASLPDNSKLYWRVRSVNTNNTSLIDFYSTWSAPRYFRSALLPPALLAPVSAEILIYNRPAFDWADVPGAANYTIQVSKFGNFLTLLVNTTITPSTFTPPTALPANSSLNWRVRSNGTNGPSPWSEIRSFNSANPPSVPVLTAPASGATVGATPELHWNPSTAPSGTSVDHYEVQIASSSSFAIIIQSANNVASNNHTASPLSEGSYYWRVRAYNTFGQYGNWSAGRLIKIDGTPPLPPALSSPLDAGNLRFCSESYSWLASSTATAYQIQFDNDSDFSSPLYTSAELSTTTFAPPSNDAFLINGGQVGDYYWHLRGRDAIGNWSSWSAGRKVTLIDQVFFGAPPIISPANAGTNHDSIPDFSWGSAKYTCGIGGYYTTGSTTYEVQLDDSANFSSPIWTNSVTGLSTDMSAFPDHIAGFNYQVYQEIPDGSYYWRVRGKNQQNEYSAWASAAFTHVEDGSACDPLGDGPATYTVGSSPPDGWPYVTMLTFDDQVPSIDQTQMVTLHVEVKNSSDDPVQSVSAQWITDQGEHASVPFTLVSGTGLNGDWQGQWTFTDTICYQDGLTVRMTNLFMDRKWDITIKSP